MASYTISGGTIEAKRYVSLPQYPISSPRWTRTFPSGQDIQILPPLPAPLLASTPLHSHQYPSRVIYRVFIAPAEPITDADWSSLENVDLERLFSGASFAEQDPRYGPGTARRRSEPSSRPHPPIPTPAPSNLSPPSTSRSSAWRFWRMRSISSSPAW